MADITRIGWYDCTLNCMTWHCQYVSPGCQNCYARVMADRWNGRGFFEGMAPELKRRRLLLPFTNAKYLAAFRIFLVSMSDPFHGRLPIGDQATMFAMMAADPRHVYQGLTKRDAVMRARLNRPDWPGLVHEGLDSLAELADGGKRLTPGRRRVLDGIEQARDRSPLMPLPNVLLGVSAENRPLYDRRTRALRQTPAARAFVSAEPLIGDLGDLSGIDWLIIGGESGPQHRPMDIEWLDSVIERCDAAGVPVWVKQDSKVLPEQKGRIPDRLWRQEHCNLELAA